MTDLIEKAVELAGWPINGNLFMGPWGFETGSTEFDNVPQHELDALAAQLVRQVDATDYWVQQTSAFSEVQGIGKRLGYTEGDNRTLNTIKAIVDSGVLDD